MASRGGPRITPRSFVLLTGVLALAGSILVYAAHLASGPPIRSDGVGYYAYLPSIFIDHQLALTRYVERVFGGHPEEWTGLWQAPITGEFVNKYSIGVAVCLAPFFVVADLLTRLVGLPRDGLSPIYQGAVVVAGVTSLVTGLTFLRLSLARRFDDRTVVWTLFAVTFGTSVFHYGSYDAVFSHTYAFCLFAAYVYLVEAWSDRPSARLAAAMGAVGALIVLVRIPNAPVLGILALYGVYDRASLRGRARFLVERWGTLLVAVAAFAAVGSLQLIVWRVTSGRWILDSYVGESFYWLHPRPLNVLISIKKGLFVYAPVLVLAVPGLFALRRRVPEMFLPVLVPTLGQLYLVSSWHSWWFGGSFGHRAFLEFIALLAFPLAAFLEGRIANPRWRVAVVLMGSCTIVLMALYWLDQIPFEGPDWGPFRS